MTKKYRNSTNRKYTKRRFKSLWKSSGNKKFNARIWVKTRRCSKKLGKSRSAIANSVRILNLDPRVLEFAKEGKLTEGHCKSLLPITDPERQYKTAVQW